PPRLELGERDAALEADLSALRLVGVGADEERLPRRDIAPALVDTDAKFVCHASSFARASAPDNAASGGLDVWRGAGTVSRMEATLESVHVGDQVFLAEGDEE